MANILIRRSMMLVLIAIIQLLNVVSLQAQHNILLESEARKLLDHFINRQEEEIMNMFTDEVAGMVPPGQLKQIADQLESQLGRYQHVERVIFDSADQYTIVVLVCRFENMELGMRTVFNNDNKVAGFTFVPAPAASFSPPPDYAEAASFTESEIIISTPDIELAALLTMPSAGSDIPLVILVHGSGPHDADETIGPNKPFRDIAWGLSSRGIAVLRYEKRTYRHGGTLDRDNFTIWDETGNDAIAAIRTALSIPGLDHEKIYLAGHSLGGFIAPAIAEKSPELAGIIIMAGNSRPLQELVLEQYQFLAGQTPGPETSAVIDQIREQVKAIDENRLEGLTYRETLLNLPPSYWQNLGNYNQKETAAGLSQRILVLQGERDYQVTMKDFAGWQTALAGHRDASLISYPELNHLLISGAGDPNPHEYFVEGNVDARVIHDIARWIHRGE